MKTLFAILFVLALPLTGRAESLNLKTGAWEVTASTTMAGMMIPKESLDQMPPAQRAKIEAMMGARNGKVDTHTFHSCVTPQDLARGELMAKDKERKNCTRKVISQTPRHFAFDEMCTAPEPSKVHVTYDATSDESFTSTMDMTQPNGKVHVDTHGRWVGATCKKGREE